LPEDAVRRYLSRPLHVALWVLVFVAAILAADAIGNREDRAQFAHGTRVEARVTSVRSGDVIHLEFRDPNRARTIQTATRPRDARPPERGDDVPIDVARDDPYVVRLAGDTWSTPYDVASMSLIALLPLLWWAWRRYHVGRLRALAVSDVPAFAMTAAIGPPVRFSKRPRLFLYPMDAGPGSAPLCALALLTRRGYVVEDVAFPVEVKGSPRPLGRVLVRAGTTLCWPAGLALRSATLMCPAARTDDPASVVAPVPPLPRPRGRRGVFLLLARICFGIGTLAWDRDDRQATAIEDRRVTTDAHVLEGGEFDSRVSFVADEQLVTTTARNLPAESGAEVEVFYDPAQPTRAWAGDEPAGTSDSLWSWLALAGIVAFAVAAWLVGVPSPVLSARPYGWSPGAAGWVHPDNLAKR